MVVNELFDKLEEVGLVALIQKDREIEKLKQLLIEYNNQAIEYEQKVEGRLEEIRKAIFEFRENDLKVLLDEIERGCHKDPKAVLFEVIRLFDQYKTELGDKKE